MKRDIDLARKILLTVEARPAGARPAVLVLDEYPPDEVADHIELLVEANLLEALDASSFSGRSWIVQRLTWEGHDFVEAARVESIWTRAKAYILDKGSVLTFEVLKQVLAALARERLSS